jgi:hypothetical protein
MWGIIVSFLQADPRRYLVSKRFNLRAFIAFVVAAAFVIATVTGIVLYVVPQGRVASWVDWTLLGLAKHDWTNVHILLGLVFIVVGFVHLYYNWKPFKHHLAERVKGHLSLRVEAIAALALATVFVAGAIAHLPPFDWLFALSERAKAMWVVAPEYEPPYGHAEDSTLDTLARRTFIEPGEARARLREAGFDLLGPKATVAEIARRNRTTPMGLYMRIAALAKPPAMPAELTPQAVEERFAGTGVGRKTVAQMCAETGTDEATALKRLREAGMEAAGGDTLKTVGDSRGLQPMQVLQVMLIGPQALSK